MHGHNAYLKKYAKLQIHICHRTVQCIRIFLGDGPNYASTNKKNTSIHTQMLKLVTCTF